VYPEAVVEWENESQLDLVWGKGGLGTAIALRGRRLVGPQSNGKDTGGVLKILSQLATCIHSVGDFRGQKRFPSQVIVPLQSSGGDRYPVRII